MTERQTNTRKPVSRVHARVSLTLSLPAEVANALLQGTDYEDTALGMEPDHDREAIGERLDQAVAEGLPHFLDYALDDADVECDW